MKFKILTLLLFLIIASSQISFGQCADSISINSISGECNGNGSTLVSINVTVLFGSGNNSAVITYNSGGGEVVALVLEDDSGDIIDQDYTFYVPTCSSFTVTLTAWTNPAGTGSSCTDPTPVSQNVIGNPPMPVEFGELKVNSFKNGFEIAWLTFSEVNNQHFEIERSENGVYFTSIGRIEAGANSNNVNDYSFYDESPVIGTNYYRIKQFDFDGKYSYSEIKALEFNLRLDLEIYPNPTSDYLTIKSELNSFNILNSNGIVIKEVVKAGLIEVIDLTELKPGLYFIQDTGRRFHYKIIVQNN